ncbi:MAG: LptA/OstA family protein [Chthoniobacterales bacterium]
MSKRSLFTCFAFSLVAAASLHAQPSASINPEGNAPRKSEDSMFSSDRPAGAQTEITAQKEATFNNAENMATFTGSVVVKDPQFTLFCDRLIVYMNENRKGLRIVEALGNVTIVQETKDEKGNPSKSIGRSGKAIFNPATGDITLTESPQIQQGINNHIAVNPATVMVLNRVGRLSTQGSSRTVIVDANEGVVNQ